jgi:NTE family protein
VHEVLINARGASYRRLRTLVFAPSQDLGQLAGKYVPTFLAKARLNPIMKYVLARAAKEAPVQEADWASYLLFDGGFAEQLIELGRRDANSNAKQIHDFFDARS